MKDLIKKPTSFTGIEFWAVTTVFAFAIFFFVLDGLDGNSAFANTPNKELFEKLNMPFNYYEHYFIPLLIQYFTLFGAFWILNFYVVPRLIRKEAIFKNILLLLIVFVASALIDGVTDTYYKGYMYAQNRGHDVTDQLIFQRSFLDAIRLLLLFGLYTILKYAGLYLLSNSEAIYNKYKFIAPGSLVAFVIWMISLFFLIALNAERGIIVGWIIVIPFSILYYSYSFNYLIPKSLPKKRSFMSYLGKTVLVLIITFFPLYLLATVITKDDDAGAYFSFFNAACQFFLTMPITWFLFKRHLKGNEELYVLKKELDQTHANFDFLRSQINPHFLFNAMNTLYGTAIQENAERTSEAIQKLSDMMRFMLQENMQEKISLSREIDYLNNYIDLQKLRTDPSPAIRIDTEIQHQVNGIQIAPMLLIPFVENAFKHGISFREPSHIKVILEVKDKTVYFDVFNSKHPRPENDPEKGKSGIGLNNVKQRLQLLYKGKHDLVIRETAKDFFVHLTMHLS